MLFAGALAGLLAGSLAAGAAPALASGSAGAIRPAETGTGDTSGRTVELVLAPETAVLADDADEYRFSVLIRGAGDDPVPGGVLKLWLTIQTLESADPLESGAGDLAYWSLPIAETEVPETAAGEEQNLTLTVPRQDMPLGRFSAPGVYLLRAVLAPEPAADEAEAAGDGAGDETGAVTATAVAPAVWWSGASSFTRLPLTYVVPFTLPPDSAPMPGRDELAEAAPRLIRLLDAAEAHRAVLAVDPRIVAAVRALGSNAPQPATELLDRLERTSSPLFMLQFADADPAVQAALGFDELLQPIGLGFATRLGGFEPGDAGGNGGADAGAADPGSSDGTVPSLDRLLAWPGLEARAWPASDQVDLDTLSLLTAEGIASLVLDSDNVTAPTGTRVQLGQFEVLVADAALGAAARSSISAGTETERAAGEAALVARLALAAQQGSEGMVLALDRGALAAAAEPAEFFDRLDALDWVDPVSEAAQPGGTATLRPGSATEERLELLRATVARSSQIDELAPLLETPEYLTEYQRVRLLEAFATSWAADGVDYSLVDEGIKERDEQLLRGVRVISTENTQLVGTSSQVPVTVHNALPFDALISLHAIPVSAAISVPTRTFEEVAAPSEGNTTVLVPVLSRVSSGESALALRVSDAAAEEVFYTGVLKLTLRSSYETIMLLALGAIAASLLGFGIWRSLRRRSQTAGMPQA